MKNQREGEGVGEGLSRWWGNWVQSPLRQKEQGTELTLASDVGSSNDDYRPNDNDQDYLVVPDPTRTLTRLGFFSC